MNICRGSHWGQPGYVEASRGWLAGGWWRLTGAGVVRGRERPGLVQVICRPPARQSEAGRGRATRGMSGLEPRDGGCRQRVETLVDEQGLSQVF